MNALRKWWKQCRCKHYWRPVLHTRLPANVGYPRSNYGAKWCDYCDMTVDLSDEEFYATFGRMPIL